MAEALIGPVLENLISLARGEFATICGITNKTEKLANTLNLINAVLEDAEEKQMTDHSVKEWLQQLKDAVYVLDDILDECSIQSHRFGCLSSFNPKNIMFRHRVGSRLKEITRRLDQIASDKNKFLLRESVRERPSEVAEWRQTSSTIDQTQVHGRDGDKEKIVESLLSQTRDSDILSIYHIVGLGGVGKTTLAQLVYNDERVSSHFKRKIWVCVSENFSIKRILLSITESITREKDDALQLDVIERKVQELLQSKRYLLVLDDVWNKTQELNFGLSQDKWNKLKHVLSCGSKGSSILVTTRDMDVATIIGTCQAHRLSGLSEDDCWLLFKQYAFGPHKEVRPELEVIGKKIINKCGGLPLADGNLNCVFCNSELETTDHIFFKCKFIYNVWMRCYNWLHIVTVLPPDFQADLFQHNLQIRGKIKQEAVKAIWFSVLWAIWIHRNSVIFRGVTVNSQSVQDLFIIKSWVWIRAKCTGFMYSFAEWNHEPTKCLLG